MSRNLEDLREIASDLLGDMPPTVCHISRNKEVGLDASNRMPLFVQGWLTRHPVHSGIV